MHTQGKCILHGEVIGSMRVYRKHPDTDYACERARECYVTFIALNIPQLPECIDAGKSHSCKGGPVSKQHNVISAPWGGTQRFWLHTTTFVIHWNFCLKLCTNWNFCLETVINIADFHQLQLLTSTIAGMWCHMQNHVMSHAQMCDVTCTNTCVDWGESQVGDDQCNHKVRVRQGIRHHSAKWACATSCPDRSVVATVTWYH